MNRQTVNGHWKIMADFPKKDGDYVVVFLLDNGGYGDPDVWYFSKNEWEPLYSYTPPDEPAYWLDIEFPR